MRNYRNVSLAMHNTLHNFYVVLQRWQCAMKLLSLKSCNEFISAYNSMVSAETIFCQAVDF